jgi:hypothetical protein
MTDAIDRAIAAPAQPLQRLQGQINLPPGRAGEQRVAAIDLPMPFTALDVLAITTALTDLLGKQPTGPASRILVPGR